MQEEKKQQITSICHHYTVETPFGQIKHHAGKKQQTS